MKDSTSAESKIGAQHGPRRVRPSVLGVLGPQCSCGVRKLNFYHQVQLRRQHLPASSGTAGFRPQEKGRGVLLDCAWTRKPDCEEARLLAGLPDVLLPERSVKC